MSFITINENWGIQIDSIGNHMPHRWAEKRVKQGGEYVGTGDWEWKSEQKYFPNVAQCLRYMFDKDLPEELTLKEYVERIEEVEKRLK